MINDILNKWIDDIWDNYILIPTKRYFWVIKNENVEKGKFQIALRFKLDIKAKLGILSKAIGFDISDIVVITLKENLR